MDHGGVEHFEGFFIKEIFCSIYYKIGVGYFGGNFLDMLVKGEEFIE